MWPTVLALRGLGGSGHTSEIDAKVIERGEFTEAQQAEMMPNGRSTRVAYYLAWARTNLKRIAVAENLHPAVWTLTELGWKITEAKCKELSAKAKKENRKRLKQ